MEQDVIVGPAILSAPGTVICPCQGAATVSINLESISSPAGFSYLIEGTATGSDWFAVAALDPATIGTYTHAAQSAVTGQWVIPCAGLAKVRFNLTAISSGDAIVQMTASSATNAVLVAGGFVSLIPSFVKLATATSGGANVTSFEVTNDVLVHVIKASAGQLYGASVYNNDTSQAYLKIYDATTATAGAGTPVERIGLRPNGSNFSWPMGISFTTGISAIVTGGIGDGDTTAPASSTFLVSFYWK